MHGQIVEAAVEIVAGEGWEGVTMQRLARDLGYAVGALYRYFPSKDAILAAVLGRVVGQLGEALGEAVTSHRAIGGEAGPRVRALGAVVAAALRYARFAEESPAAFRVLAMALGDPRELVEIESAKTVTPAVLEALAVVYDAMGEAKRSGALPRAGSEAETAALAWGAVHGALQLRKLERLGVEGLATERLVEAGLRALLMGLGADEDDLRAAERRARKGLANTVKGDKGARR